MTILHHLFEGQKITMLDPCSGFSGRLIGSYASGIVNKYIGMDLSEKTYDGLVKTKEWLDSFNSGFIVDIHKGSCLDILPSIKENIDFIFTSPPFLDEEEYTGVPVVKSYDTWKSVFIRPFIEKCYAALKKGGKFSVYTEAIRRNDFPLDFCNIAKEVGFKKLNDINFKMPSRENLRKKSTFRVVKVIVFEK
jgi:tRNA1(Val) A37 N6-methylase TrmN6